MILKGIKKKIAAGVLAGAFAVGVVATPALAATSEDCIASCGSSVYTSSPAGAQAVNGLISWTYNEDGNDKARVNIVLKDVAPDGAGPVARVIYTNSGNGRQSPWYPHLTTGNGKTQGFTKTFTELNPGGDDSITVQICNGYDANGAVKNCGAVHGPFHAY